MTHSKRIDLMIIKKCINKCIFCSESLKFTGKEVLLNKVKKILIKERKNGAELVHLVGGEPTIHSQFSEIAKYAKFLGYRTFIITNGIMFSSLSFCEKVLPYIDEIMISVHGHDKKSHNLNTGNNLAYDSMISGLKNIKKMFKGRLEATTAMTIYNYKYLTEIAKLINKFGIKEYQCMTIVPTGKGGENFFSISPTLKDMAPEINRVIGYCDKEDITVRFSGVPMCILGANYLLSHDVWENFVLDDKFGYGSIELWKEPDKFSDSFKIDMDRVKTGKCSGCEKRLICGGIYRKYYNKYRDRELKAFKS